MEMMTWKCCDGCQRLIERPLFLLMRVGTMRTESVLTSVFSSEEAATDNSATRQQMAMLNRFMTFFRILCLGFVQADKLPSEAEACAAIRNDP